MNLAFQELPGGDKYSDYLQSSNSFIIDQGVAVFALALFALVILGMMIIMFMMLRYMFRESKQQDKIIMQNSLNQVGTQRNTEEVIDLKKLMGKLIEVQTQSDIKKNTIIETGIASIDKLDGSVNTMQIKVDNLEKAIREMIDRMEQSEGKALEISEQSKLEIVKAVTDSFEPIVKKCLQDAIRSTQEVPPVPKAKPTDEPKEKTE